MPADQGLLVTSGSSKCEGGRAVLCTTLITTLTDPTTNIDVPPHGLDSGSLVFCRTDEALYICDRDATGAALFPNVPAALGGQFLKIGQAGVSRSFALFTAGLTIAVLQVLAFGPAGQGAYSTGGSGLGFVAPRAGNLRRLKFRLDAGLGGSNTFAGVCTLRIFVNGVVQPAMSIPIPGGYLGGLLTADVPVPVAAGDLINLVIQSPEEAPGPTMENFSIECELE